MSEPVEPVDLSDLPTSQVVGFDGRGGLTSTADGDFALQNDAGTNSFTIDVDGDGIFLVEDNRVSLVNGTNPQEFRVYGTDDGAGNAEYLSVAIDGSGNTLISTDATGTGSNRDISLQAASGNVYIRDAAGTSRFNYSGGALRCDAELNMGTRPITSIGNLFLVGGFPTSDPAVAGQVWNNAGVLTVSAG